MKTEEELNALRDELQGLKEKLSELSDEEMEEVTGGFIVNVWQDGEIVYTKFYHKNCGGEIKNVYDLFKNCVCEKCKETHYFLMQFDYESVDTRKE